MSDRPHEGDESRRRRREAERKRLFAAAVEAEQETGRRESTEASARSNVFVRLGRITLGSIVLLGGLVAMIGPGPGLLLVAAGLGILSRDVAWADRLLQKVKSRLPTDESGGIPRSTIVTMVLVALAATAVAVWWMLR